MSGRKAPEPDDDDDVIWMTISPWTFAFGIFAVAGLACYLFH